MNHTPVTVAPGRDAVPMGDGRWNPWRELRGREHVDFLRAPLPRRLGGGFYWPDGRRSIIVLDTGLRRAERNAVLTHELVHDERGGGSIHPDPIVRRRDERSIDREVARRLVPLDELEEMAIGLTECGTHVDARLVADWFDVPVDVAERALQLIKEGEPGWNGSG